MGIGNLINGFQEGYSWADNVQRQQKEDAYRAKAQAHQQKQWDQQDDYESQRKALHDKYFGDAAPADPTAPTDVSPSRAAAMTQGAMPDAPADGTPTAAAIATPMAAVSPVAAQASAGVPAAAAPAPSAAAPAPAAQAGYQPIVLAPGTRPSVTGAVAKPAINPNGTWSDINASAQATQPGRNSDYAKLLQEELAKETDPKARAALQNELANAGNFKFVKPDASASAPDAAPAPAATIAAQGVDQLVQTKPSGPDLSNTNKLLDYAMESAKLDMQYGKMDGAGLLTLQKVVTGMKHEGMDRALSLMQQGRYQEAQDAFNAQGDHSGMQIVAARDGSYTPPGTKLQLPTKIVTMRAPDGSTKVLDTAQTQYQLLGMEKQIAAAQTARGQDIQQENAEAQRADTRAYREGLQQDSRERISIARDELKLKQKKDDDELPTPVKLQFNGIQDRMKSLQAKLADIQKDPLYDPNGKGAKDINRQLEDLGMQQKALMLPYMKDARPTPGDGTIPPRKTATVQELTPSAATVENPFNGAAPPAPATPAAKAAQSGTGTGKPKQSWAETKAAMEQQAAQQQSAASRMQADPDLQALQTKKQAAAAKGDLANARQYLAQIDALKKQRYGQ